MLCVFVCVCVREREDEREKEENACVWRAGGPLERGVARGEPERTRYYLDVCVVVKTKRREASVASGSGRLRVRSL